LVESRYELAALLITRRPGIDVGPQEPARVTGRRGKVDGHELVESKRVGALSGGLGLGALLEILFTPAKGLSEKPVLVTEVVEDVARTHTETRTQHA
jgi:hypothetical protein